VLAISKRSELGLNAAELVEADCLELDAVQKVVAGDEGVASLIEKKKLFFIEASIGIIECKVMIS
jgi:hypothetical protein